MGVIEDKIMTDKIKERFTKYLKNRGMTYEDWLEHRNPTNYVNISDLIPGYLYKIKARNALFGIWLPQRFSFLISRVKFRSNYLFEEFHCDIADHQPDLKWHGTAFPLAEMEQSPFKAEELNHREFQREDGDLYLDYPDAEDVLEYLNSFERDDPERQHLLEL